MKKGQVAEGRIDHIVFPNKGIAITDEGEKVIVKDTIPGQRVSFLVNKVRKGKAEARLLETVEKSPLEVASPCPHSDNCGGCTYQTLPYEEQLKLKENQVRALMEDAIGDACEYEFLGIKGSPKQYEYRNKMEFSFGDGFKGGPLALGQHKRGSFYDILTVTDCQIVDEDFRNILMATVKFFGERRVSFFHRVTHEGVLRHLLVRKAVKTQEILIDLVMTTQYDASNYGGITEEALLTEWKEMLLSLPLKGIIKGILRTKMIVWQMWFAMMERIFFMDRIISMKNC